MPYTDDGKAVMLYGLAATISHISLHSGVPTDGNELSGGVYRRMRVDFRDPDSGEVSLARAVSFDVPEGARVTHAGFWNASSGGILLAWERTNEHTFRGRGVYVIDLAKLMITS